MVGAATGKTGAEIVANADDIALVDDLGDEDEGCGLQRHTVLAIGEVDRLAGQAITERIALRLYLPELGVVLMVGQRMPAKVRNRIEPEIGQVEFQKLFAALHQQCSRHTGSF